MESQPSSPAVTVTTRSAGIRFGLIAAVVGIAYFVILNSLGMDLTQGFWSWFRYCITIVLLFLAHKYYKDNGDGFMNYGQGIGITVWMGLVSVVIGSIFTYIYIKFIDASFIQTMKDVQEAKMQEKGMSDEQVEQAMKFSAIFMTPEAIFGFGLVFGFIGTLIVGLIVSIFTQKKRPETAF
jgi:hypothetical protein